jgi:hypothetical protein
MPVATKKRAVRPNQGSTLRPRAEAPRRHFLYIEVTEDERKAIHDYCIRNQISVSQFLAELLLEDASKPRRKGKVLVRAEFELTPEEQEKLELLARLHNKASVGEFIRELIQPNLDMQKLHTSTNLETTALRFYLSEDEHETITKYIAEKGIPARKYAAMLALKAIAKDRKKRK